MQVQLDQIIVPPGQQGLEADDCFYIENEAAVRGKPRIDLNVDWKNLRETKLYT